jgi:hypothetical protein
VPTLQITIKPAAAAEVATIQIDGTPLHGKKLELEKPARVHVSVTAIGFTRFAKDIVLDKDMTLDIDLAKRDSKKKRTLAVTLGMGALGVVAWLVRRR